jgi:hypothetical protein
MDVIIDNTTISAFDLLMKSKLTKENIDLFLRTGFGY